MKIRNKVFSILSQLIIGSLLIRISMIYLSKHPAEKVGIFSSLDYVYQKINGISRLFNGRSEGEMDDLVQFKNSFAELKQVASSKACEKAITANQLSQANIDQIIQSLESVSAADFNTNKSKYIAVFSRINEEIQRFCK